ncbi:MAG: hypothetical protein E7001_01220 [Coriobacteriaceae bacterium]|nr:hypothetical protein [Coriobacteriaceae bacterium]
MLGVKLTGERIAALLILGASIAILLAAACQYLPSMGGLAPAAFTSVRADGHESTVLFSLDQHGVASVEVLDD